MDDPCLSKWVLGLLYFFIVGSFIAILLMRFSEDLRNKFDDAGEVLRFFRKFNGFEWILGFTVSLLMVLAWYRSGTCQMALGGGY